MKKGKCELIVKFSKIFFDYLGHHPFQGCLTIGITLFFLGIKTCADEIGSIIVALHICN